MQRKDRTGGRGDPLFPTEIGEACGKDYHSASSWAHPKLVALEKRGLVRRGTGCWFLTDDGAAADA
jgi:hypothetical protein